MKIKTEKLSKTVTTCPYNKTVVSLFAANVIDDIYEKYEEEICAYTALTGENLFSRDVFTGVAVYREGDVYNEKLGEKIATKKAYRQMMQYFSKQFAEIYKVAKRLLALDKEVVDFNDKMIQASNDIVDLTRPDPPRGINCDIYITEPKIYVPVGLPFEKRVEVRNGVIEYTRTVVPLVIPTDGSIFTSKKDIVDYFNSKYPTKIKVSFLEDYTEE